jgi:hypothetical protein
MSARKAGTKNFEDSEALREIPRKAGPKESAFGYSLHCYYVDSTLNICSKAPNSNRPRRL